MLSIIPFYFPLPLAAGPSRPRTAFSQPLHLQLVYVQKIFTVQYLHHGHCTNIQNILQLLSTNLLCAEQCILRHCMKEISTRKMVIKYCMCYKILLVTQQYSYSTCTLSSCAGSVKGINTYYEDVVQLLWYNKSVSPLAAYYRLSHTRVTDYLNMHIK